MWLSVGMQLSQGTRAPPCVSHCVPIAQPCFVNQTFCGVYFLISCFETYDLHHVHHVPCVLVKHSSFGWFGCAYSTPIYRLKLSRHYVFLIFLVHRYRNNRCRSTYFPHKTTFPQVKSQLFDVQQICGTARSFAALRSDGRVVTWGQAGAGGESSQVQEWWD